MKNNSKGDGNKNDIELLLREALRSKHKPSQELNDYIICQWKRQSPGCAGENRVSCSGEDTIKKPPMLK